MLAMRTKLYAATLALAASLVPLSASAADYYAGKTIDLIIGSGPAGGYDIYGRALARHINKHIPGKPNMVVKNMPGAGCGRAAGFLAKIAPKDGTVIAGIMPGAIMGPLLEDKPEILFDPTKVQYIGTANNGTRVCVGWAASGAKALRTSRPRACRSARCRRTNPPTTTPTCSAAPPARKFKIVAGYDGTTQIGLAMERGEVVGACGWDWASFKAQRSDWLRDKKANVLLQISLERERGAHQDGRPARVGIRQDRGGPQAGRAGDRPAGVPALLHRAAGNPGRAAAHPAHCLRRHHEGSGNTWPSPKSCASTSSRCRRTGAGDRAQAARHAEGRGAARASGDPAVATAACHDVPIETCAGPMPADDWLVLAPGAPADYYAGKTIDFIIGGNPGGGFDIYARALARHWSRHIPGNPTIVAKNMPGAGSTKAGIHVCTIAAKDGLTIGAVTPGAITGPLLDDKPTLFVPTKVTWIGSANVEHAYLRGVRNVEDQELRRRDDAEIRSRWRIARRCDPRLCSHAAQDHRPQRHHSYRRLQGDARPDARNGARRSRRHVRMGLVEREIAEA